MNIKESNKIYIHYSKDLVTNHFDRTRFKAVDDNTRYCSDIKVSGGLWGSPIDSDLGWKDLCDTGYYRDYSQDASFMFRLKPGNKVLTLKHLGDERGYPRYCDLGDNRKWLDRNGIIFGYETLLKMGIDAVEVEDVNRFCDSLWGWDCESIFVINPDVIEEVMDYEKTNLEKVS